ncbi:MAG: serine/threonine protein kinase, partial [Planctomycetaceae bacterium]|jgi:serine/threonine-protein kinase|nr:serine/threonine protein kinase [Planctomycetaceae bacterium]
MVEEHDVFPLPQALNYLLQIAQALAHAATHGVVHRDVKPSNILITREGRAKLIDMGLARLMDTSEARGDLTASGVTLGTFDYISPEQARDPRNADIRSDIYSLGCTFFFMLAGRPPFPEGTVLQKLLQHQGDSPPDIRSFQPAIPGEIAFIIQKMMAKDPKQRYQSPTVLVDALTDAARRLGLHLAGGNLVWTPARSRRISLLLRHLPWITSVSLLLAGTFLMTFLSDQFFTPLPIPPDPSESNKPTTTAGNESPLIPDSWQTSPLVLSGTFVARSAEDSTKSFAGSLRPPVSGGGLRHTIEGAVLLTSPIGGTLSIAELSSVSQDVTAQRPNVSLRMRCVDPTGSTPGSYLTLASALTDVEDETTIQLKWNNTSWITEPIRFDQRNLQFVAADGYNPVLLFEPSASQNARSFFTVMSSTITFRGVGIEIRPQSNVVSTHWSMFESSGSTKLTFEKCCLTIRNESSDNSAHHEDVVFFRNGIPPVLEGSDYVSDPYSDPLRIELIQSLLRGEAVAIQNDVPQDVHFDSTDSLIALALPFLKTKEDRWSVKPTNIQIHWIKTVFFGRQGVADLVTEMNAKPVSVHFDSKQSVVVLNSFPFSVFRGTRTRENTLKEFQWSGTDNYFQGVSGLRFSIPPDLSLVDWKNQWSLETRDRTNINALSLREITKPMCRYLPQEVRSLDATGRVSLPDLNWFPPRWDID